MAIQAKEGFEHGMSMLVAINERVIERRGVTKSSGDIDQVGIELLPRGKSFLVELVLTPAHQVS
jgi:hypothetical protein